MAIGARKEDLPRIEIEKYLCAVLKQRSHTIHPEASKLNIERLSRLYDPICILDANEGHSTEKSSAFDQLIALGSISDLLLRDEKNALHLLQAFLEKEKGWKFGFFSYDLKNTLEAILSENEDKLGFPILHLFVPKFVIRINGDKVLCHYDDQHSTENEIEQLFETLFSKNETASTPFPDLSLQQKVSKPAYIQAVKGLQSNIQRGDIYEVNFCTEFYAENAELVPAGIYKKLNAISKAPFAAFYKHKEHSLISSSPERFLKKTGNKIISQPIKGTIARSLLKKEDEQRKSDLRNNLKEQTENVMIVDLVRNDLSRIAKRGTVKVDELFGVYSFLQVHHLISTISCEINEGVSFTDILKATFPMGSMTGAPKLSAMKLIEAFETTKRGAYSGTIGYIDPQGDFDLSVIIRSILYNSRNKYVSFMAGSAITAKAEAEKEYEECLLKAKAMFEALTTKY